MPITSADDRSGRQNSIRDQLQTWRLNPPPEPPHDLVSDREVVGREGAALADDLCVGQAI